MIKRQIEFSCDVPECKTVEVLQRSEFYFTSVPVAAKLPDGWHVIEGYVGQMTGKMICPRHTYRFADGEIFLEGAKP